MIDGIQVAAAIGEGATWRTVHPRPEIWGTSLLLAVDGEDLFGYLLGFSTSLSSQTGRWPA